MFVACLLVVSTNLMWTGIKVTAAAFAVVGIAGLAWFVLTIIALGSYRRCRLIVIAPLIAAVAALLVWADGPLRLGVSASGDALDSAVQTCSTRDSWVGAIRVDVAVHLDGGCHLFTHSGFFSTRGLAHLPDGPPASPSTSTSLSYEHLTGDWYRFIEEW